MAFVKRPPAPQSVEDYLALPYTIRITPDPTGGYVATVDELPGCISQGETWAEVGDMIRDAMAAWISTKLDKGQHVPTPEDEEEPARVLLRLPRWLHRDVTRAAKSEGASVNQRLVALIVMGLQQDAAEKGYATPGLDEQKEEVASAVKKFRDMAPAFEQAEAAARQALEMAKPVFDSMMASQLALQADILERVAADQARILESLKLS